MKMNHLFFSEILCYPNHSQEGTRAEIILFSLKMLLEFFATLTVIGKQRI